MSNHSKNLNSSVPSRGDILIDRNGNQMIVLDIISTGDCYVLCNGKVKLVNSASSFITKTFHNDVELSKNFNLKGE
jgi:hypothetical protein